MKVEYRDFVISVLAGLAGGLTVLVLLTAFGHLRQLQTTDTELEALSRRGFERTLAVMDEMRRGVQQLESVDGESCSDSERASLGKLVRNSLYLKSANIHMGGNRYCSDTGIIKRELQKPHLQTADGAEIWLYANNPFSARNNTLLYRNNGVLLSTLHDHLLNIVTDNRTRMVLYDPVSGNVLARHPSGARLDPNQIPALRHEPDTAVVVLQDPRVKVSLLATRRTAAWPVQLRENLWPWLLTAFVCGMLAGALCYRQLGFRRQPAQQLKRAVRSKSFEVNYQPIVAIADGRCLGAECLIRWQDEDGRPVRPDHFVPIAEEIGLIEAMTDIVLEKALMELGDILRSGTLYLSINLSASDMIKRRFYPLLRESLIRAGLDPRKIAIEATERGFVDAERANAVITEMRDAGHSILIDDFGTGYSSLSYLQKLAIDVIKIDKAFVDAINTESATSSVIVHIIAMAKQLGLKTVAEGIETEAQALFLKAHGVDAGQGWYYSKPLTAAHFRLFLENSHAR
ncbi:EAL domain-containing protein [Arenimonas sp. GDDSR-1]|uniref:EAL domain-containing protein n=1 Tax=Arenimonas sp. GDDSR-1 TaxID=2950125 RepID=UPI0026214D2F|nr:EAL domain-containing protein [Arenimonas sp. GDDSR-1]